MRNTVHDAVALIASSTDTEGDGCMNGHCSITPFMNSPHQTRNKLWRSRADKSCGAQWIYIEWDQPQALSLIAVTFGQFTSNASYYHGPKTTRLSDITIISTSGQISNPVETLDCSTFSPKLFPSHRSDHCGLFDKNGAPITFYNVLSANVTFHLEPPGPGVACQMDVDELFSSYYGVGLNDRAIPNVSWLFIVAVVVGAVLVIARSRQRLVARSRDVYVVEKAEEGLSKVQWT
ncbi:hypothetical protein BJ741DRAFT_588967 [Chytriomyces cf. hyalinus JEL632]|nr:hypothetical protein BJ741DRAFT_588967 [Chytriomyces cf. hyalinus JEL632]